MADNGGLSTYGGNVYTDDLTAHEKKNGRTAQPHASDAANEWYYKKQEAELNHRYSLDSAAVQNQYMIDQWNRENAYNDPTAVAKRYRAAGINPRAAFGTGSASGAGLSAHMNPGAVGAGSASGSYGKSDVSQGAENAATIMSGISDIAGQGVAVAKSIGGLTNTYADTTQKKAVTEGIQIENKYKEQKILTELSKERSEIAEILSNTKLKDSEREFYKKRLEQIDQEIMESGQRIEESGQRIEESKQNIAESQTREQKLDAETDLVKVQKELENNRIFNVQMDTALKAAQKGHYGELKKQIAKEVEFITEKIDLTEQQKKKVKNDIALNWAKYGASVAQMTSQEIRNWIFGFIPGVDQKSTNFFGDEVPMFAD